MLRNSRLTVFILALAGLNAGGHVAAQEAARQRSDVLEKYTWNLADLFATSEEWESTFSHVESLLPAFETFRGHLGDSPEILLNCLKLNDSVSMLGDQLELYAGLLYDQDQRVSENLEKQNRHQALGSRVSAATSFIVPEILSLGEEKIASFLNASPALQLYRFFLNDLLRTRQHTLSPREEEILSLLYPVTSGPQGIFDALNSADLRFGTVTDDNGEQVVLTRQRYARLLESPNQLTRRAANQEYVGTFQKYLNGMVAALATSIQSDWFYTQVRGYRSCLERRLDEDNVPTSVFFNLIEAVNQNLAPLHKWTSLRKRILGLDTLYTYDLDAPLADFPEKNYTWEEAVELVHNGLKPMGAEYVADADRAMNSRWIDVFETQGKRTGGYNWAAYPKHAYIMLNFDGRLGNVFTVAHEIGHALHARHRYASEPFVYSSSPKFTAEVASTAHEALLMKYLLDNAADKKEKLALLIEYIGKIEQTFFTQVFFSEFEETIHKRIEEGGALSAGYLRRTYRDLYQKYWGPDLTIDSLNDMGGARVRHFYRNYYVFQYATGYAASQMMAQRVLSNEPGSRESLFRFLKRGSSMYAMDILKEAGVDMNSPEPVKRTIDLFERLVDEVELLLSEN